MQERERDTHTEKRVLKERARERGRSDRETDRKTDRWRARKRRVIVTTQVSEYTCTHSPSAVWCRVGNFLKHCIIL